MKKKPHVKLTAYLAIVAGTEGSASSLRANILARLAFTREIKKTESLQ